MRSNTMTSNVATKAAGVTKFSRKSTTEQIPTAAEVQKFEQQCIEVEAYLKRKAEEKVVKFNEARRLANIANPPRLKLKHNMVRSITVVNAAR
jgi:cell division protein FtsL